MRLYIGLIFIFFIHSSIFGQNMQKLLQTKFIMAAEGEVIEIPEGIFDLKKSLWLDDKKEITIRGAGMDKSILRFNKQEEGAEGIKITNAQNIRLEGFTIQNSIGDAIKAQDVDHITFYNIKTEWTGRVSKKNGAYGLYPVQCTNVIIDACVAIGASDAGIYVGQSDQVIVKNCYAFRNVAGIEIENTTNADVFNNIAKGNTGGILVFDLPGLEKKSGGNIRVYNNKILENNFRNFAPKGNSVAFVPAGTGIILLAAGDVEIFKNEITDHKTFGIAIASYYTMESNFKDDGYNPFIRTLYIHNNKISRKKRIPTLRNNLGKFAFVKFKRDIPDIVFDGLVGEQYQDNKGHFLPEYMLCIQHNGDADFANFDVGNKFKNMHRDIEVYNCDHERIEPNKLNLDK